MNLARRAIDDPERVLELEASLDDRVSELLAEANDAGYSLEEATQALLRVVRNQAVISAENLDVAEDHATEADLNGDPFTLSCQPG